MPTKQNPDSFNYKTFNSYSNAYWKDRTRMPYKPEEERSHSLWGRRKGKEREQLMMTYSDAKECYFHPRLKRPD